MRDLNATKKAVVIGNKNKDIVTRESATRFIINALDCTPETATNLLNRWVKTFNLKLA